METGFVISKTNIQNLDNIVELWEATIRMLWMTIGRSIFEHFLATGVLPKELMWDHRLISVKKSF